MSEAFSESSARVKENLLRRYAEREPKRFCQLDLDIDDIVTGGEGPSLTSGATIELMHGCDVRILIRPDLDPKMAVKLPRWAADSVEREPDQIDTWRGIHDLKPTAADKPKVNADEKIALSHHLVSILQSPGDLPVAIVEMVRKARYEDHPPLMKAALAAVDHWRIEKRVEDAELDAEIPF